MTEVVVSDMDLGLEEDTITTYWLSYDRFIGFLTVPRRLFIPGLQ